MGRGGGGAEGGGFDGTPRRPTPKQRRFGAVCGIFSSSVKTPSYATHRHFVGGKTGKTGKKGAGNGKRARPRGGFGVFFSFWGFFVSFLERRILVSWFVMEMGEL